MKNPYQEERDLFKRSMSSMSMSTFGDTPVKGFPPINRKSLSISSKGLLKSSKEQFKEFQQARKSLAEYNELKQTKNFINKRDRIMKNSWRHGVVGVENPNDPDSEVYSDIYQHKLALERDRNLIQNRRNK